MQTIITLFPYFTAERLFERPERRQEFMSKIIFAEPCDLFVSGSSVENMKLIEKLFTLAKGFKKGNIPKFVITEEAFEIKNDDKMESVRTLIRMITSKQSFENFKTLSEIDYNQRELQIFNERILEMNGTVVMGIQKVLAGKNLFIMSDPIFLEALAISLIKGDQAILDSDTNGYIKLIIEELEKNNLTNNNFLRLIIDYEKQTAVCEKFNVSWEL